MARKLLFAILTLSLASQTWASDPTKTSYSASQCEGSLTPYPTVIERIAIPDSLEPIMIYHVGRHGSRYPASSAYCMKLREALMQADSLGTITSLGREFAKLNDDIIRRSSGLWGALDSLGMAEQRAIATRMHALCPMLFKDGAVRARSSYSPRAMMSMMSFVHQLDRLDNTSDYFTSTGRTNSALLRPFDIDPDYEAFREEDAWRQPYEDFLVAACPTDPVARLLGKDFPFENADHWRDLAMAEYYVIAGMSAMGMNSDASRYFTNDEYNSLWSCFNLRQYLQRSASTISTVPAEIASPLVLDIINTADRTIAGTDTCAVTLNFAHAETIMPLASLLRLPGCHYLTNYFDTVALNWHDFYIVPMASNIQFILLEATNNGRLYLRVDLNERPVSLIPGNEDTYIPWGKAHEYLMNCVPLYAQ